MKKLDCIVLCVETYENLRFWEIEEHHAGVLDTSGPAKLCWHMVRWLQDRSRASKPVLAQVLEQQGQQTCAGAGSKPVLAHTKSKVTFLETLK